MIKKKIKKLTDVTDTDEESPGRSVGWRVFLAIGEPGDGGDVDGGAGASSETGTPVSCHAPNKKIGKDTQANGKWAADGEAHDMEKGPPTGIR